MTPLLLPPRLQVHPKQLVPNPPRVLPVVEVMEVGVRLLPVHRAQARGRRCLEVFTRSSPPWDWGANPSSTLEQEKRKEEERKRSFSNPIYKKCRLVCHVVVILFKTSFIVS